MVLQIVELDFIEQQLGGDALQSLPATMGACPQLRELTISTAQPLSEQLPLTLGSEVAGRSSWQHLRSLSLLHTGVASFVDEAALLLGQLTALQLVHAAALPEDHRLPGSGGAASIRATPRAAALQLGGQLWRQYDGLLPAATLRHLELAGPFPFRRAVPSRTPGGARQPGQCARFMHAVDLLVPAAIWGGGW